MYQTVIRGAARGAAAGYIAALVAPIVAFAVRLLAGAVLIMLIAAACVFLTVTGIVPVD